MDRKMSTLDPDSYLLASRILNSQDYGPADTDLLAKTV
jgi:hypothetical protein